MATGNSRQLLQRLVALIGPKANHDTYTGLEGELVFVEDNDDLYVHDGATQGGTLILKSQTGTGSPESVVTAIVGSLFVRTDGTASTTLYAKTSGTGNTGWVAIA